jgi:hypothetical protein
MKTKICTTCNQEKEILKFSKDKTSKDGFGYYCKLCASLKSQLWYNDNKQKAKKTHKIYHYNNRLTILEYQKEWRKKNPDKNKIYKLEHRKEISKKELIRQAKKYKEDVQFRILCNLRSRLHIVLKGNPKSKRTLDFLACSKEFLKHHLEAQFTDGMTWENYGIGGWEVDHIYPCASFNLSIPEEQEVCFNWSNLQPLWANDNRSKGAKDGYRKIDSKIGS